MLMSCVFQSRDGSGAHWRKEKRELERSLGDLQAALKEERRVGAEEPEGGEEGRWRGG